MPDCFSPLCFLERTCWRLSTTLTSSPRIGGRRPRFIAKSPMDADATAVKPRGWALISRTRNRFDSGLEIFSGQRPLERVQGNLVTRTDTNDSRKPNLPWNS